MRIKILIMTIECIFTCIFAAMKYSANIVYSKVHKIRNDAQQT